MCSSASISTEVAIVNQQNKSVYSVSAGVFDSSFLRRRTDTLVKWSKNFFVNRRTKKVLIRWAVERFSRPLAPSITSSCYFETSETLNTVSRKTLTRVHHIRGRFENMLLLFSREKLSEATRWRWIAHKVFKMWTRLFFFFLPSAHKTLRLFYSVGSK